MKNLLLAVIIGPIEYVLPAFLVAIIITAVVVVVAIIGTKIEEKNVLNKGMVIYPETLFEDIEEMKNANTLRLYSKRIERNLFVITSSEISEEYKDGKFISYFSQKPTELRAKKTPLKEFIQILPEINYVTMIKRIGFQTRIGYNHKIIEEQYEPITHYSDIGFTVKKPEDVFKIFEQFHDRTDGFEKKTINDLTYGECEYKMHKLGNIRYCYQYNEQTHKIYHLSLGYENENISTFGNNIKSYAQSEGDWDFPTICVTNGSISFWFSCLNLYDGLKKSDSIKLKISSFANSITIKNPTKEVEKTDELKFANECYVIKEANSTTGFVSGIIKGFNLKINEITRDRYWEIDIDCLGAHIRVLADYRLVKSSELEIGKVLCGEMWNTAFIVE